MIDDKYVKALLERILLDEQHHLEAFKAKGSTVIRIDSEDCLYHAIHLGTCGRRIDRPLV